MGEIADMMLDGILCEQCGILLEDDLSGYPRKCPDCSGRKRRKHKKRSAQADNNYPSVQTD